MTQTKAELLQTRHQGDIRLGDADSSHYVGFKAPATVSSSLVWVLPAADGSASQILKTDGSGNLGWATDSATDSTKMPLTGGIFTGDVTFDGATAGRDIVFDRSRDALAFKDNAYAEFGDSQDLQIFHNGSHSYIKDIGTGSLIIQSNQFLTYNAAGDELMIVAGENAAVELYYNGVKTFETLQNGARILGSEGNYAYLHLWEDEGDDNADKWRMEVAGGSFKLANYSTGSWVNGLTLDGSNHATFSNNVLLNTDSYLKIGVGEDLQLTHNGTHSYINNSTGNLYLRGSEVIVAGNTTGETIAHFIENGAAIFRYDNVIKFETTSAGTKFTGGIAQVATAAGALELDLNTSNYFTKTISGNSTFTFANPAASGQVTAFTLELTHSSGTVTWPSSVKWNADTAPTLTTGKTHLFMFVTDDGGTRYRGSALVDYVN